MKLKELRMKNGLSQKEVGEKIGLNFRVYARYEREERNLSLKLAIKLADLYDVTIDEVIGRERKEVKKDAE